jgi:uncharacterized protein YndB with AHSA1/START domain
VSGPADLVFITEVAAPRSRLFAALTQGPHLERWFCDRAASDPRAGGILELAWTGPRASAEPFRGQWIRWDPPSGCAYRGGHSGYPDGDAGVVSFDLEPLAEGTRLRTRHAFPEQPGYDGIAARYRDAWPRALGRLVAFLTPNPTI